MSLNWIHTLRTGEALRAGTGVKAEISTFISSSQASQTAGGGSGAGQWEEEEAAAGITARAHSEAALHPSTPPAGGEKSQSLEDWKTPRRPLKRSLKIRWRRLTRHQLIPWGFPLWRSPLTPPFASCNLPLTTGRVFKLSFTVKLEQQLNPQYTFIVAAYHCCQVLNSHLLLSSQ